MASNEYELFRGRIQKQVQELEEFQSLADQIKEEMELRNFTLAHISEGALVFQYPSSANNVTSVVLPVDKLKITKIRVDLEGGSLHFGLTDPEFIIKVSTRCCLGKHPISYYHQEIASPKYSKVATRLYGSSCTSRDVFALEIMIGTSEWYNIYFLLNSDDPPIVCKRGSFPVTFLTLKDYEQVKNSGESFDFESLLEKLIRVHNNLK